MLVVIQCGGRAKRWEGREPKGATVVTGGERLVERTARLVAGHEVRLVADPAFAPYVPPGVAHVLPPDRHRSKLTDGWQDDDGDVLVLFGDVWFSEYCIQQALKSTSEVVWIGRQGPGGNGKRYGEIFGLYARPGHLRSRLRGVAAELGEERAAWRARGQIHGHFCNVDDATEDFDRVVDLERWRAAHPELLRPTPER